MDLLSYFAGAASGVLVLLVVFITFLNQMKSPRKQQDDFNTKMLEYWDRANNGMVLQRAVLIEIADAIREKKSCNPATA